MIYIAKIDSELMKGVEEYIGDFTEEEFKEALFYVQKKYKSIYVGEMYEVLLPELIGQAIRQNRFSVYTSLKVMEMSIVKQEVKRA